MPANLTADYLAAEKRYKEAREPQERLGHLEEMLRLIPKHKGTDHLQGDIKRRISKLKQSLESKSSQKRSFDYSIPKEGAGQVILVGPPNCGKSSLVAALTNAAPEIAPYPYTTVKAAPAMMPYEDASVQLIDAPAVCAEHYQTWMNGLIRNADLVLSMFDAASDSIVDDYIAINGLMEQHRIRFDPAPQDRFDPDGKAWCKVRYVANKVEQPGALENLAIFFELTGAPLEFIRIDTRSLLGIEPLRGLIWQALNVLRIYTKAPSKPPDMRSPVILPVGSTVLDFARSIHKDFARNLEFCRIWGEAKYDGMRVPRDHVLCDRDVVELHL
ncbi:MAG: GTPase [Candidatus Alcyoniella australis]|nr:GTPase [Candidatus Alcyoniella australis]